MKRNISIILPLLLIACLLASCGSSGQQSNESTSEPMKSYKIEEMTIKVPEAWDYSPKENNHYFYIGQDGCMFFIQTHEIEAGIFDDNAFEDFIEGIKETCKDKFFLEKSKDSAFFNDKSYYIYEYITDINGNRTHCKAYLTYFNYHLYSLMFCSKGNVMLTAFKSCENTVMESASFNAETTRPTSKATEAPTTQEPTTEEPTTLKPTDPPTQKPTEKPQNAVSTEFLNALSQAESYSKTLHMSKQAIYDQLTSEYGGKFGADAAQYAVDNVNADWKANALKSAESYNETLHMSKAALYDSSSLNTARSSPQRKRNTQWTTSTRIIKKMR